MSDAIYVTPQPAWSPCEDDCDCKAKNSTGATDSPSTPKTARKPKKSKEPEIRTPSVEQIKIVCQMILMANADALRALVD